MTRYFGRGILTLLNEAGEVTWGPYECTSFEVNTQQPEPEPVRSATTSTLVLEPFPLEMFGPLPSKPVKTNISERHRTLLRKRW